MSTGAVPERLATRSPARMARIAGFLYFLSVLTAVFNEFFAHLRLGIAGILIPVSCQFAVTLLLYGIFRPVNKNLSSLALASQFVALTFEVIDLQPYGINIGMAFHGVYCLLIGFLILRSAFVPRWLGVPMAVAGLIWLIYLSPPIAHYLSPYNTASGLLGEGLPMLWLLVQGVNSHRWKLQAGTTTGERLQCAS